VNDLIFFFLACKAPPTVNDGGTEGVQTDAANGQQVVSTHADMSLFWCVNTCRCVGRWIVCICWLKSSFSFVQF
jgi:hypothetical protein